MSVISRIEYMGSNGVQNVKTVGGHGIDKVTVGGTTYNFAQSQSYSGSAYNTLTGSAGEPLRSYSVSGKSVQASAPSGFSPVDIESVLDGTLKIYSHGINMFTTDMKDHVQAVTFNRLSSSAFECYGSFNGVSGIVRFAVPDITAGNYYFSFKATIENSPESSRRNEFLVWTIKNGVSTVKTVYSCGGDTVNSDKGFWLYLTEDCDLAFGWYTNMGQYNVTDYYAKLENISLIRDNRAFEEYKGKYSYSVANSDIKGNRSGSFSLGGVNGVCDKLTVNALSGTVTYEKRTEEISFDGSEEWTTEVLSGVGNVYSLPLTGALAGGGLCTHLVYDQTLSSSYSFKISDGAVTVKMTGTETLADFESALSSAAVNSAPLTIRYALALETDYEITDSTVKSGLIGLTAYDKTSVIEFIGSVKPDVTEISYWKKINS